MTGKNPLDCSGCRSKGAMGGGVRFPHAKYRTICDRLFKFYLVIYILSDEKPNEFSVGRSKRGLWGGEFWRPSLVSYPPRAAIKSLICGLVK